MSHKQKAVISSKHVCSCEIFPKRLSVSQSATCPSLSGQQMEKKYAAPDSSTNCYHKFTSILLFSWRWVKLIVYVPSLHTLSVKLRERTAVPDTHNTNIWNHPLIKTKQTHKTILLDLLKLSSFRYCSHSPVRYWIRNEQIKEHFTYSWYTRFSLTERIS